MSYKKVILICSDEDSKNQELKQIVEHIKTHYKVILEQADQNETIEAAEASTLVLLYLNDPHVKTFLKNHLNSDIKVGILPAKKSERTLQSYGISKDIYEAIDDAFNKQKVTKVDLLLCNGEVVLSNVIIGDLYGVNHSAIEESSIFSKIRRFYESVKNVSFKDYTLTLAKEQVIQTAAVGIMVLEHNSKSVNQRLIQEELPLHDGKLNAFVLAPTNILSYLFYLIAVFFYSMFTLRSMPKTIGVIKTSKMLVSSQKAIDFQIDSDFVSAKEIELEVLKNSINITLGRNIEDEELQEVQNQQEVNDTIKVKYLPKGEMRKALLGEPLPFFKRAEEEDFKELFTSLRESAKTSSVFVVLMILSSLLATTGLYQNSAPVIIGAMILAPLMSPIISLSMGVVRAEASMTLSSLKTLFFAVFIVLVFSALYTYLMPLDTLTSEMRGRVNPNILDLMVAIISGIAGAYANAKSEVAKSLAGVAIAVALVPPLSVTGIGIGWGDLDVIYGSFLLFITNFVGIMLSSSLTFLILGYSPVHRAKKGLVYTFITLILIAIPLVVSFEKVVKQNNIFHLLDNKDYMIEKKLIKVDVLEVDLSKKNVTLFIHTISDDVLDQKDFHLLKESMQKQLGEKMDLRVSSELEIR